MENKLCYAAVQNGCILDVFETKEQADACIRNEIKRDWLSIIARKRLRKLFAKSGDVALHRYSIMTVCSTEEIK